MPPLANPKHEAFAQEYLETENAVEAARIAGIPLLELPPRNGCPYVYFLLCPQRRAILYVGKGRGRRMFRHTRDAKKGRISGLKKYRVLRALIDEQREPYPVIVAVANSDRSAFRTERGFISRIGISCLANSISGTHTTDDIVVAQVEDRLARIKPFDLWIAEEPRSAREVEWYRRIVGELEIMRTNIFARAKWLRITKNHLFCNGVQIEPRHYETA